MNLHVSVITTSIGGAENAGVENEGAITHRKLSEKKTIRYQ